MFSPPPPVSQPRNSPLSIAQSELLPPDSTRALASVCSDSDTCLALLTYAAPRPDKPPQLLVVGTAKQDAVASELAKAETAEVLLIVVRVWAAGRRPRQRERSLTTHAQARVHSPNRAAKLVLALRASPTLKLPLRARLGVHAQLVLQFTVRSRLPRAPAHLCSRAPAGHPPPGARVEQGAQRGGHLACGDGEPGY